MVGKSEAKEATNSNKKRKRQNEPSKRLYVNGRGLSKSDLKDAFSSYGAIDHINNLDEFSFVEMEDLDEAIKAREGVDGTYIGANRVSVDFSRGNKGPVNKNGGETITGSIKKKKNRRKKGKGLAKKALAKQEREQDKAQGEKGGEGDNTQSAESAQATEGDTTHNTEENHTKATDFGAAGEGGGEGEGEEEEPQEKKKRVRQRKKTRSKQKNMRKDTRAKHLKPTYRKELERSEAGGNRENPWGLGVGKLGAGPAKGEQTPVPDKDKDNDQGDVDVGEALCPN